MLAVDPPLAEHMEGASLYLPSASRLSNRTLCQPRPDRLGEYGRLGHGDGRSLSRPALVESLVNERVTQIAAGAAHSVAVSWEGEAFTWGWGFMGTLGHGNEVDCFDPTRMRLPDYVGPSDASGAADTLHDTRSTLGADDSTADAAGCVQMERVTCAAAARRVTVLGTSRGRVLCLPNMHTVGFDELGRLPEGLRCWRVETALSLCRPSLTVFVIDSAGHAHILEKGEGNLRASFVSTQADEGCKSCGDGMSMGRGGEGGGIVDSGQRCAQGGGLLPVSAAPLRPTASLVKCCSVLVSPSEYIRGEQVSFVPDGVRSLGWRSAVSVAVVSDDGSLMTATTDGSGVYKLRRRRSDGVVCAAVVVNQNIPYGLLMVDGGASLLTWGSAITGQVRRRRCFDAPVCMELFF